MILTAVALSPEGQSFFQLSKSVGLANFLTSEPFHISCKTGKRLVSVPRVALAESNIATWITSFSFWLKRLTMSKTTKAVAGANTSHHRQPQFDFSFAPACPPPRPKAAGNSCKLQLDFSSFAPAGLPMVCRTLV